MRPRTYLYLGTTPPTPPSIVTGFGLAFWVVLHDEAEAFATPAASILLVLNIGVYGQGDAGTLKFYITLINEILLYNEYYLKCISTSASTARATPVRSNYKILNLISI